jgi:hypothetical protein
MLINLDPFPEGTPNPPPWGIEYLNEEDGSPISQLPLARTIGLEKLGFPNVLIRFAPPNIASAILDRIGVLLIIERKVIELTDTLRFAGLDFALVPELYGSDPALRISWERDPGKLCAVKAEFNKACALQGIKFKA